LQLEDVLPHGAQIAADWLGLTGSRVVVVGAGGIGSECAKGYAAAGANVVVVDRDQSRLDELLADPEFNGQALAADLTLPGAGAEVIATAIDLLGGLDILLHCVGVNDRRPVLDFSEDEWEQILKINLFTGFSVAQAAGRHMVEQKHGRIIVLSSVSGLLAHKNHAPYAASKGGLNQMIQGWPQPDDARHGCGVGIVGRDSQRARPRLHRDASDGRLS
jgi:gluconate 5-dehydrogenase